MTAGFDPVLARPSIPAVRRPVRPLGLLTRGFHLCFEDVAGDEVGSIAGDRGHDVGVQVERDADGAWPRRSDTTFGWTPAFNATSRTCGGVVETDARHVERAHDPVELPRDVLGLTVCRARRNDEVNLGPQRADRDRSLDAAMLSQHDEVRRIEVDVATAEASSAGPSRSRRRHWRIVLDTASWPSVEVDVRPAKAEHLAAAHTGRRQPDVCGDRRSPFTAARN